MTPAEAIQCMLENTHCLFTVEKGNEIAAAFGVSFKAPTYKADGHVNPKGLTLDNGAKEAKGFACFDLAEMICRRLGILYPSMMGRGFQVRACCEALDEKFNTKGNHVISHV